MDQSAKPVTVNGTKIVTYMTKIMD